MNSEVKEFIIFIKTVVAIASAAITIIVTVAMFVSWSNLKSLREELRTEAREMKDEVKDIKKSSYQEIQDVRQQTNKVLESIRKDAESVAIITSNRKVQEKFANTNLDYMIENVARKQVNSKLNVIVEKEVEQFMVLAKEIPDLTTAAEMIRWHSREHVDYLDSMANFHISSEVREIAQKLLFKRGMDYVNGKYSYPLGVQYTNEAQDPYTVCGGRPKTKEQKTVATNVLANYILSGDDVTDVVKAFCALNELEGTSFKVFDITGVKNWYYSRR